MPRKIEKQVALDRALTVFWDHGYRGTSMYMLSEQLGVEKPSIYASFGSKHKLYLSALGHYREWLIGSVRHIMIHSYGKRSAKPLLNWSRYSAMP
jgi:AcrR family transcriptional regulator